MINTVTHAGQTFTRKGKKMTHAVITSSRKTYRPDGAPHVGVEWASSLELAQKNHSAHLHRAEKVARGEKLTGVFSSEYYEKFLYSVIVEATHGE